MNTKTSNGSNCNTKQAGTFTHCVIRRMSNSPRTISLDSTYRMNHRVKMKNCSKLKNRRLTNQSARQPKSNPPPKNKHYSQSQVIQSLWRAKLSNLSYCKIVRVSSNPLVKGTPKLKLWCIHPQQAKCIKLVGTGPGFRNRQSMQAARKQKLVSKLQCLCAVLMFDIHTNIAICSALTEQPHQ